MRNFTKLSLTAAASLLIASGVIASGSSNYESTKTYEKPAKAQKLSLDVTQVQLIQFALNDLGHKPGAIDGKWGPASANAVKAYQASVGETQTGTLSVNTACYLLQVGTANHGSAAKIPSWCGFN